MWQKGVVDGVVGEVVDCTGRVWQKGVVLYEGAVM